ncbi:MAG: hypothetical protein GW825_03475, partial [Gallionella sp.]|nr:hypothetical protein [Gallionella sp.]
REPAQGIADSRMKGIGEIIVAGPILEQVAQNIERLGARRDVAHEVPE